MPAQPQPTVYPVMVTPQSYMSRPNYYQSPPSATTPAQWTTAAGQWRWAPQNSGTSLISANPYIYPVQTMVSPDAAMYASNAQTCQSNTDLTDGSAGEPLEYYYGAHYPSAALC